MERKLRTLYADRARNFLSSIRILMELCSGRFFIDEKGSLVLAGAC